MMTSLVVRNQTITLTQLVDQIKEHKHLTNLTLDHVTLYGYREELRRLCSSVLHGHATLEKAVLRDVHLVPNVTGMFATENAAADWDYLMSTLLVDVPNLTHLSLEHLAPHSLSTNALCCIMFGKKLQTLRLVHCHLSDKEALLLARMLTQASAQLQSIDLSGNVLSPEVMNSIRSTIQKNPRIRSIEMGAGSVEEDQPHEQT